MQKLIIRDLRVHSGFRLLEPATTLILDVVRLHSPVALGVECISVRPQDVHRLTVTMLNSELTKENLGSTLRSLADKVEEL